jgi:chemotaxis response regulator CheB
MFQVVVQSAMRQLKSKLRLPAPPTSSPETDKKSEPKDRTGLILVLAIGGGLLLMAIFSNLPSN